MNQEIKARIEQINRGQVPDGYKNTNQMIIPFEWSSINLGELGTSKNGLNFRKDDQGYTIYCIGVADFKDLSIISGIDRLSEISLLSLPDDDFFLKDGDILFVRSNGSKELVGRNLLIYTKGHLISYSGFCIRFRIKDFSVINPLYLNAILDNGVLKKKLLKENQGSNINNLNQDILETLNISFPENISEQLKLIKILTTQDKVIELKEKLIYEKKQQKKWLMQNLLTGKKRLDGFSGEWEKVKLVKLFDERTERNSTHLELLAITGTRGVVPRSYLGLKDNSSEDKSKYLKICAGDIGYNTMRMWQGVSAYSEYEGIVSPAYTILKPKPNINAKYFSYLFKMPSIVFMFYRFSQGLVDDTRNLKYSNFKQIKVYYPTDIKEQNAIAEILSTADREIELLKADLSEEKQKKKALMQLLLTGIVRV